MDKKRSIVITGASSGLGKCLSKSFSKSYDVINISRTISSSVHNIISNFSDLKDLKYKLKTKKLNHELCILNAGTMGEIKFASEVTDQDFLDTLKINVVANKIIIDWSILNGCKNFIGISSGAAKNNYDGWLNYCISKSAFRAMFLQYQKDLPKLRFKLISPGILKTEMNKKIKAQDVLLYPEMKKFHETIASPPQKASDLIYNKYSDYFKSEKIEIDLRDEAEW
jgi:benzil reductase ((S)-benzoin forming)